MHCMTSGFAVLQACQPKWCTPVYSNTVGPDAVYYEETACTSEVVDPDGTDFPGKLKLPRGSYLADVFYTALSAADLANAGGANGMCMPKDIELVDLRLHVACLPEQVLPSSFASYACRIGVSSSTLSASVLKCVKQDPFLPGTLHRGSFMRYDCSNRSVSFECNQDCSICNGTRSVEPEALKCRGVVFVWCKRSA
jgi:hypothetical protein